MERERHKVVFSYCGLISYKHLLSLQTKYSGDEKFD